MRKIAPVLCFLLIGLSALAQVPDFPQVFSPNAAELGKYGKMPVDYFSGLPSITIPLTELRARNYTLPIYQSFFSDDLTKISEPKHFLEDLLNSFYNQ